MRAMRNPVYSGIPLHQENSALTPTDGGRHRRRTDRELCIGRSEIAIEPDLWWRNRRPRWYWFRKPRAEAVTSAKSRGPRLSLAGIGKSHGQMVARDPDSSFAD